MVEGMQFAAAADAETTVNVDKERAVNAMRDQLVRRGGGGGRRRRRGSNGIMENRLVWDCC